MTDEWTKLSYLPNCNMKLNHFHIFTVKFLGKISLLFVQIKAIGTVFQYKYKISFPIYFNDPFWSTECFFFFLVKFAPSNCFSFLQCVRLAPEILNFLVAVQLLIFLECLMTINLKLTPYAVCDNEGLCVARVSLLLPHGTHDHVMWFIMFLFNSTITVNTKNCPNCYHQLGLNVQYLCQ
jgi:hypothetical protein